MARSRGGGHAAVQVRRCQQPHQAIPSAVTGNFMVAQEALAGAAISTALNFITGSGNQVYYGNNMTASLIVSIPTLLVYLFLGRYFLRGLLSGSLKG